MTIDAFVGVLLNVTKMHGTKQKKLWLQFFTPPNNVIKV
jgi:hypothetical protein